MKLEAVELKIVLNEIEAQNLWDIVMFALDLQKERDKQGKTCMTDDEKKLAIELTDLLEKFR